MTKELDREAFGFRVYKDKNNFVYDYPEKTKTMCTLHEDIHIKIDPDGYFICPKCEDPDL